MCTDTASNLTEIIRVDQKTADHVRDKFDQVWMCRYPWMQRLIHDGGPKFIGHEFQTFAQKCQVKTVQTTAHNPTANAICERSHLTIQNLLRVLTHHNPPETIDNAKNFVDQAIATTSHALRVNVSKDLGHNLSGSLAFNRDMLLDVPFIADWEVLRQKCQLRINERLRKTNKKRKSFDYQSGKSVLVKTPGILQKLGEQWTGPYTIVKVHDNGNMTL